MKSADCIGSCNNVVVVAANTTSLPSSSSLSSLSSSQSSSSSSSSNVARGVSASSALRCDEEEPGLACWQRGGGGVGGGGGGGLRDLHSSSDTDDCDLDLGVGRLIIDLEADPDARTRCPPIIEMKSSSSSSSTGQQQQQVKQSSIISHSSSSSGPSIPIIHAPTAPIVTNNTMEAQANPNLARTSKTSSSSSDNATTTKPSSSSSSSSHRSMTKNLGMNTTTFLPMTMALGDLTADNKGIKMRIKCNQSAPNSTSGGTSTMKHEILPYHTPFIPSVSSENLSSADGLTMSAATKASGSFGSLSSRSNCSRSSSHKKDRHSTKDRSKTVSLGRSFGEELLLASSARASPSSSSCSSAPIGCSLLSSSVKDCVVDVAVRMDVVLSDGDGGGGGVKKEPTVVHDPYEFNMKMEEMAVGLPVKKMKLEKCDAASSPFVDHSQQQQQDLELKDAEIDACHIGVITEPECLGPCEPGTSVTLEGIVWNETENGLLVVNVTWRGKTYVGTLMDSTKHHWAPPRFSGDSPTSDFETRTPKGRGKRGRTCAVAQRNEGNGSDRKLRSNRSNKPSATVAAPSPVRNDSSSLKRSRTETASSDGSRGSKCSRSDSRTSDQGNGTTAVGGYGDLANGGLIECPEENCSKKYRNLNGLRYHQTRMHKSACTSLVKEVNDAQTNKYASDDFVESSSSAAAAAERFVWRTKPGASVEASKRMGSTVQKPTENEGKIREGVDDVDSQTRVTVVNGIAAKEEEASKEKDASPSSLETELKADESPEPANAIGDESNEQSKGASGKGVNSFMSISADDYKKLDRTTNQPVVTITPAPTPAETSDDNTDSTLCQVSSATSTGSLGAVTTGPHPAAPWPHGNTSSEDAKSQLSNDQAKSDGERGSRKSKSEKSDRNKVKLPTGCVPRPVVPQVSSPSSGPSVATVAKPLLLSSGPAPSMTSLQTSVVAIQQLKPVQSKPLLSSEQASLNLAMLTDKSTKKRKREKERPRDQQPPLAPGTARPHNKPSSGSETSEASAQLQCPNAPVPPANTSPHVDYAVSGSGPPISAVSVPSGSSEGFGLQPSASESGNLVGQPELVPVVTRCSPAPGAMPQFPMHPTATGEQLTPAATARPTSDSSGAANQPNIQLALPPPPSPINQQRLPVESMTPRPVVVLQSPLSAMKAVPSSVIKNTSGFEVGSNLDPSSEPVADTDLPSQPLATECKLPVVPPGSNSEFTMKSSESSGKPSHEGLHPTSGTNPQLTSPCKKSKSASAKHADAGGNSLTDFGNPHSPAYSDISDANDNAPMLDAPMLEKEAQAAAEEEEEETTIGSKVSPSHPQDSYVYSPFYGQPPYLTPAVTASDIPDSGPALKSSSSLSKPSLSDKHLVALEKVKSESTVVSEKRHAPDSAPVRSRPAPEMTLKFPGENHPQLRERDQPPLRDDKGDAREKGGGGGRVAPAAPGPLRTDVHKSQHQHQQQQQQQQQHKMFSGEAMLPQQAAVMHHMMMPASYGFGPPQFGYYSQEYSNEMQRIFQLQQQQQQQQQESRRHEQQNASKSQSDNAGDHGGKSRQAGKVPADGKPLPTPPSLIPDRNRHDVKDEADRGREKQLEGRKPPKDTVDAKNLGDGVVGTKPDGGYDMKTLADRNELQRYCIQSHFLEQQQQQQRLNEHQSHKSMMESGGGGGCKPSAVVAPQARDKNTSGIPGNASMLHISKQSSRDDATQSRGHDGHRSSHRDSQKNPSAMTPPQQHSMQHKSGAGATMRDGSSGRAQKDAGERGGGGNAKDDSGSGPSGSRGGVISKGKDDAPMTSLPVSMPTGIPAPYAPYYGHYLPTTPYGGAMPFDPTHAPLYPGMMGYAPAPYIHPQMLSPALAMASADVKPCDILAPTQPPAFFSNEGQAHKIHELKEVAKMQQSADGSQPSPGNRDPSRPKSSSGSHTSGKDTEHSSPPTQRHVHTHHHMHVVGLPYRFVSSDAAIIASQQAAAATDATQIPRPFLK